MKNLECEHHRKSEEGYNYKLSKKETLWLCKQCHLNLAEALLGQLAIEVFVK